MSDATAQQPSRREVFRGLLRYLALAGISVASIGLVTKGTAPSAGEGCRRSPFCGDCEAIAWCNFPQALAIKKHHNATESQECHSNRC